MAGNAEHEMAVLEPPCHLPETGRTNRPSVMAVNWQVELIPDETKSPQNRDLASAKKKTPAELFFGQPPSSDCILESLSLQRLKTESTEFMDVDDDSTYKAPGPPSHVISPSGRCSSEQSDQLLSTSPNMRKSSRERKKPRSFSPELGNQGKKRVKKNVTPNLHLYARPYDKLPDGRPFSCDICKSPYICEFQRSVTPSGKKVKYSPRYKTDPKTMVTLTLCNSCGLSFDRAQAYAKKPKKLKPSLDDDKKKFAAEAHEFSRSMVAALNDPDADRLSCSHYTSKPCGCLQTYIRAGGESDYEHRARKLLELVKKGKLLISEKKYIYGPEDISVKAKKGVIGLGNGQKRSKEYVRFVLDNRLDLRDKYMLCEKATQRILSYSNNFLHKRLKTEGNDCRKPREKGRIALGMVMPISQIHKLKCCANNCARMALTHRTLLTEWRNRVTQGQMEARRVIAEMLTPSGGTRTNCYIYISAVTGTSASTIGRVREQMRVTGGKRDPPEHGLKKYWEKKQMSKKAAKSVNSAEEEIILEKSSMGGTTTNKSGDLEGIAVSQAEELKLLDRDDTTDLSVAKIPSPCPPDAESLQNNASMESEQIMQLQKQMTHQHEQQLLWHQLLQQSGTVQVLAQDREDTSGKMSEQNENVQIIYTQPVMSESSSASDNPQDILMQALPTIQSQLGLTQGFPLNQVVTIVPMSSAQLVTVQRTPSVSIQPAVESIQTGVGGNGADGSGLTPHAGIIHTAENTTHNVSPSVLGSLNSVVPVIPKVEAQQQALPKLLSSSQSGAVTLVQSPSDTSVDGKTSQAIQHQGLDQSNSAVQPLSTAQTVVPSLAASQPITISSRGSHPCVTIPLATLQHVLTGGQILHLPTVSSHEIQTQPGESQPASSQASQNVQKQLQNTEIDHQAQSNVEMCSQQKQNPEIVLVTEDGECLKRIGSGKVLDKQTFGHSEELYQLLIENRQGVSVTESGLHHVIQVQTPPENTSLTEGDGLQVIHLQTESSDSNMHSSSSLTVPAQSLGQVNHITRVVRDSQCNSTSDSVPTIQTEATPNPVVSHEILAPSFKNEQNLAPEIIRVTPTSSTIPHQIESASASTPLTSMSSDFGRNAIRKSAEIAQVFPLSPATAVSDDVLGNVDSNVTLFTEGLSQNDVIIANQDDPISIPQYYDVTGNTLLNTINMASTNCIIAQLREYNPHMTFIQASNSRSNEGGVNAVHNVPKTESSDSRVSVMANSEQPVTSQNAAMEQ